MTAVLFDFSGTLFRVESTESWLRGVIAETGVELAEAELADAARGWRRWGTAGRERSLLPARGRRERLGSARQERGTAPGGLHRALPACAAPRRPAARSAVRPPHVPGRLGAVSRHRRGAGALRERGIGVGVVSNIGWDIRPVFREHGLDPYVDTYVLSYEHGVQKPDPRLFRTACAALDVDPRDVVMVGDDRRADGGAATLGCAVHFVDHLPAAERPDGLRPVLELVGAGARGNGVDPQNRD
nr:HAD family hydrolase [Streptomyces chartreusis]